MAGPDDVVEMPALGRPFQLGMLYDCRRDTLLSEHLLLDRMTCQKNTEERINRSHSTIHVLAETLGEKAAALDIQPSLLTSLLCGLFEVSGAAKYLLGPRKSSHQESITHELAIERVAQLSLDCFRAADSPHSPALDHCMPSHVVTAVWYGDQIFQDYDQEASELENVEDEIGSPEIKKKTDLRINDEEKAQHQNFASGFSQENNPVTCQGARKIQTRHSKILVESKEMAVPVKVRLYPLKKLGLRQFARPFHDINLVLNSDIRDYFGQLIEIDERCNDLLNSSAAKTFPEIRKKIQHFKDLCGQSKETFQKELAKIVPSVREGVKKEKDLEEVLKCKQQSPFNPQRLSEHLGKKEQEVTFVNSLLWVLKDIKAVSHKSTLNKEVLDPRTDFVVAFMFTSLHKEEPYFSKLKAFLSSSKQLEDMNSETQRKTLSSIEWFEDENTTERVTEAAKSFSAFAHANISRKETKFIVASTPDDSSPGASVYLYESRRLKGTFEPPSKPLPVLIEKLSHDSIQLRFHPAQAGRGVICSYQVEYRIVGQEKWAVENTKGREEMLTIRGLHPDTEYQIRYAVVSKAGLSESSDVSDAVKLPPASPSGMPKEAHEESPSLAVGDQNTCMEERNTYCPKERNIMRHTRDLKLCQQQQQSRGNEMENVGGSQTLTPNRMPEEVATTGPKPKGESKDLASSLLRTSRMIRKGPLSVYSLPLDKLVCNPESTYLKYRFGEKGPQLHHKVIMLLGETGAGKSTLINGMVNYILGVRWEDDYRFSLVQEVPYRSQTCSQTDKLTAYKINFDPRLEIPYSLTIIDTPGFGDIRGMEYDRMLLEQMREFFLTRDGTDHIDAVCMVVQASQPRLTPSQKYVFDSVLSVFGKDIQGNIQILITFADGKTPPVLEAIKAGNVPCAQDAHGVPVHFSFNNSALFASNRQADEDMYTFNKMYWEMEMKSLKMFFQTINDLEPRSLTLTAEVLNERKELEAAVQGMKPQITRALVKLEEARKTCRALEKHQMDMEANRNFEYEVETIVPVQIDISGTGYCINCQKCWSTCHYPCGIPDKGNKWKCAAINKLSQHCNVCPGKCRWDAHANQSYMWGYCVRREKRTYAQLKEKYQEAYSKQMTKGMALAWINEECRRSNKDLGELIMKLSHHLQRLQEIALKPNPMTTSEYLDLLISSEKEGLQPGYEERIKMLAYCKGWVSSKLST